MQRRSRLKVTEDSQDKTMWMPTSAIARGCIGNTALGSLRLGSLGHMGI